MAVQCLGGIPFLFHLFTASSVILHSSAVASGPPKRSITLFVSVMEVTVIEKKHLVQKKVLDGENYFPYCPSSHTDVVYCPKEPGRRFPRIAAAGWGQKEEK